jgi:plastocyanin
MRVAVLALTLVAVASGAACGSSGTSSGDPVNITAANTTFSPTDIKLPAGKKVTFMLKNTDTIEHNLTIEGLKVKKDVEGGKTGSATVSPKAGTYPFHCEYHPEQMKGTVTVS